MIPIAPVEVTVTVAAVEGAESVPAAPVVEAPVTQPINAGEGAVMAFDLPEALAPPAQDTESTLALGDLATPEVVQRPTAEDAIPTPSELGYAAGSPSAIASLDNAKRLHGGYTEWLAPAEGIEEPEEPVDPAEHLAELPANGFESDQYLARLQADIIAIGLPVDNFRAFQYEQNDSGYHSNPNAIGGWGIGPENKGTFYIYSLLDRLGEYRLGTLVHESAHANTPMNPENTSQFGGEAKRQAAELFAKNLADQSLLTDTFLNGYHAYNAKEFRAGRMSKATFIEETQAIASELGVTNRAKLEQIQEVQLSKVERLKRAGEWDLDLAPVNLISKTYPDGHTEVDGIDHQLIALTRDVENYGDLMTHIKALKPQFYHYNSATVASGRFEIQNAVRPMQWIVEMNRRMLEEALLRPPEEDEDEEGKESKRTSTLASVSDPLTNL